MTCNNCGQEVPNGAAYCPNCSAPVAQQQNVYPGQQQQFYPGQPAPSIPNYLVWAILSCICCCIPTGIVAIVFAARVDGLVQSGDINGALEASKNAKIWSWVSFGIGVVWIIICFIAVLIPMISAMMMAVPQ
ncbi:MAG: CD225/dispanin family protein [Candidatus Saccharibacteria bacterium]